MNFNWLKNKKFTVIAAVLSTMLAAGTACRMFKCFKIRL